MKSILSITTIIQISVAIAAEINSCKPGQSQVICESCARFAQTFFPTIFSPDSHKKTKTTAAIRTIFAIQTTVSSHFIATKRTLVGI